MNTSAVSTRFTSPKLPEYDHTQRSPLPWLVVGPALAVLGIAYYAVAPDPQAAVGLAIVAAIVVVTSLSFGWLRVIDEGESLLLRFGPAPLFRKRLRYETIEKVERDRSSILDGWGIHWIPLRGWTFNVWGRDCVRLTLTGDRTIRIGTDDSIGLARFLGTKLGSRSAPWSKPPRPSQ